MDESSIVKKLDQVIESLEHARDAMDNVDFAPGPNTKAALTYIGNAAEDLHVAAADVALLAIDGGLTKKDVALRLKVPVSMFRGIRRRATA